MTVATLPAPLRGQAAGCDQASLDAPNADPRSLLIDIQELSRLLSRSAVSLARDEAAGRLPQPLRISRAKRWRRADIETWIRWGCPPRREFDALQRAGKK
jgi:predicted DNA-binding transcriptional regulator AlpA